jgi:hypothetical protein
LNPPKNFSESLWKEIALLRLRHHISLEDIKNSTTMIPIQEAMKEYEIEQSYAQLTNSISDSVSEKTPPKRKRKRKSKRKSKERHGLDEEGSNSGVSASDGQLSITEHILPVRKSPRIFVRQFKEMKKKETTDQIHEKSHVTDVTVSTRVACLKEENYITDLTVPTTVARFKEEKCSTALVLSKKQNICFIRKYTQWLPFSVGVEIGRLDNNKVQLVLLVLDEDNKTDFVDKFIWRRSNPEQKCVCKEETILLRSKDGLLNLSAEEDHGFVRPSDLLFVLLKLASNIANSTPIFSDEKDRDYSALNRAIRQTSAEFKMTEGMFSSNADDPQSFCYRSFQSVLDRLCPK